MSILLLPVCQRSLVCPLKVQVSCVWDANCHISFCNSLAGDGPTRAAPGPRSVKKMCRWHIFSGGRSGCSGQPQGGNQRRRKVGYPPSALPPGALKPYGVSLPFTRRFSPMRRGRTLAAPPSYPVGEHIVRPRLCRRFPLSCTAFHFFDSLRSGDQLRSPDLFCGVGERKFASNSAAGMGRKK